MVATQVKRKARFRAASPGADGKLISSWHEVRAELGEDSSANEGGRIYLDALESISRGSLEFGYLERRGEGFKAVVVEGDRLFGVEVAAAGKMSGFSGYVDRLASIRLKKAGASLRLDAVSRTDPSWSVEARNGKDALESFAELLNERINRQFQTENME